MVWPYYTDFTLPTLSSRSPAVPTLFAEQLGGTTITESYSSIKSGPSDCLLPMSARLKTGVGSQPYPGPNHASRLDLMTDPSVSLLVISIEKGSAGTRAMSRIAAIITC